MSVTFDPQRIYDAMDDAEERAWTSLAGYKFMMFGYHAARWVSYNQLLPVRQRNPFRSAVKLARKETQRNADVL